jgi:sulfur carrier protein ThiS
VAEGSTIGDIIELFKIPSKSAHLVMVNGVYIKPEERNQYVLKANDALAICPPVAGG